MFFRPSRGFSSSVAIVRHNAARCDMQYYPHVFKVCCCAFSAAVTVASLLYSRMGTFARICLSSQPANIYFTKILDPDLSLQVARI